MAINSSSGRFRSTRLSTPVPTTFPRHGSGQKSSLRTPRAVSSIAGPASAREKRIGELLHRVEAVAVSGISLSIHASEVPEPCMAPARERESLQAMAELKPEERSLTNIDRKKGYRKTTDAGSTAQRLDVSRGIIQAEGLTVSGTALSVRTSIDEARRLTRQNQGRIDVQGRTQLGQPGIERHLRGRMPTSGHRLAAHPNTLEKNTARIAERLFNHPVCDSWQIVLLSRHYPALLPKGFSSNPTFGVILTGRLEPLRSDGRGHFCAAGGVRRRRP